MLTPRYDRTLTIFTIGYSTLPIENFSKYSTRMACGSSWTSARFRSRAGIQAHWSRVGSRRTAGPR